MSQPKAAPEPASRGAPAWELEFARLIAFPAEPAFGLKQNWWQEIVGSQPDDYLLVDNDLWEVGIVSTVPTWRVTAELSLDA